THRVPTSVTDLSGEFRFAVTIPTDIEGGTEQVTTGSFTVQQSARKSNTARTPAALLKRGLYR
ncbi:MAG: hypothetical protein QGH45_21640, partial [Myxococcota bacterium]|nr:hypothetical protein [Myxococcota bacterium]